MDSSREAERQLAGRSLGPSHPGPKPGGTGAAHGRSFLEKALSCQLSAISRCHREADYLHNPNAES